MTIANAVNKNSYPGAGNTGPFPFNFMIFAASDLRVLKRTAAGVESVLAYPADYSVTGIGVGAGGSITTTAAIAVGDSILIRRVRPLTQTTDLRGQASFLPEVYEDAIDSLTMMVQQHQTELDRRFGVDETVDPSALDLLIPVGANGQVIGWGPAGITNMNVSSGAVVLPGEGRTVATLSSYLSNNALYNPLDYGAVGNGVAADDAAVALTATKAAITNGILVLPPGKTFRITANQTIPSNVPILYAGGKFTVDVNKVLTINGNVIVGRDQWITGAGQVSFRSNTGTGFSFGISCVYPEWWGAFPSNGLILAQMVDCGPGFQAAVRSGSRRVSLTEGCYALITNVLVNEDPTAPNDLIFEGTTRTGSYIVFGPAGGSYGAINAGFINKQNNGKLSFRRLRFSGSGFPTPAFLGYAIYALENGAVSQAIFSGEIDDCWIGLGTSAVGFFYGALNNYVVMNCTTEAMKDRFMLVGPGNADITFKNICEYGCYGPLVDAASDTILKNTIRVEGIHVFNPQDRLLLRGNNVDSFMVANVTYQESDPVVGGTLGICEFINCRRFQITNSKACRFPGSVTNMLRVIKLNGCSGCIDNMWVDGGDYQLELQGNLDIDIVNSSFLHALTFSCRFVALTYGRVRFANSRLQYSLNGLLNFQVAGNTVDLILENVDLLDGLYGAGAAGYASYFSTKGKVRHVGGRIGRTTNIALGTAWAAVTAYIEGDIRSDGGINYYCMNSHTSSAAGAGGNEPGVGATWQTYWFKHVSNMNAILYIDEPLGTYAVEGTELLDPTILLKHGASTQNINSQRWLNNRNGISADKGDASIAIAPFSEFETVLYATNLTIARVLTINWIAGVRSKFRVTKPALGAGTLDVGPGLKLLAAGVANWCDVEYDGAAAKLTANGNL